MWDLDDAGLDAVARYFASYGPADADLVDYRLGNGLSAGPQDGCAAGSPTVRDQLVSVDVEGQTRISSVRMPSLS